MNPWLPKIGGGPGSSPLSDLWVYAAILDFAGVPVVDHNYLPALIERFTSKLVNQDSLTFHPIIWSGFMLFKKTEMMKNAISRLILTVYNFSLK